jgi:ribose 1,5-bisphosphokinase
LIETARARLAGAGFAFPRRWITTPLDRGEGHVHVTEAQFDDAVRESRLALHWTAHGLRYGIPADIRDDLQAGSHVLVNVSRSVIGEARSLFARVRIINITAPADVVRARLAQRGRESPAQIEERVRRAPAFTPNGADVVTFCNDLPLPEAADAFVSLIVSLSRP